MTPCRPAVVVNPIKARDIGELRRQLTGLLADVGEPLWYETTPDDPGVRVARSAVAQGADLVLSYGGDGTHRACAESLAGTDVPLGLLPAGTGNLLARQLRVPSRLERAVEVSLHGERRCIDVCHADRQCFLIMSGMGFDADVLANTSAAAKERVGWLAYWLAGLRSAGRSPVLEINLDIGNGRQVTHQGVGVIVANVGRLPGGLNLLPHAAQDDGLLTVAVLTHDSVPYWMALTIQMLRGGTPSEQQLPRWQATRLRVTVDQPVRLQVDGEVLDEGCEREFSVSPRRLIVCVPPAG